MYSRSKVSEMCREKPRVAKDIPPVAHDLGRHVVSHLHHHVQMVGAVPFKSGGARTLPPNEISPADDDFKGDGCPFASLALAALAVRSICMKTRNY